MLSICHFPTDDMVEEKIFSAGGEVRAVSGRGEVSSVSSVSSMAADLDLLEHG